jgi:N-acetylglucosamine kinase-like BadF-type ATPase
VRRLLERTLPAELEPRAIGLGAQGLDTAEIAEEFAAALSAQGIRARCVNDAALLVPAAGLSAGIGLIAGTGSIGVGTDGSGAPLITGGWGWVIGDEAGAAGIVREATRAALRAHDDGLPDDGLLSALCAAFGVGDAERLARTVNDEPTMDNWGPAAPAVFAAADDGSTLASTVVENAGRHLARLVDQLVRRGATGADVVAAGSVIVGQPRLFGALVRLVGERHPAFTVHLLTDPPVAGAVALARELHPA